MEEKNKHELSNAYHNLMCSCSKIMNEGIDIFHRFESMGQKASLTEILETYDKLNHVYEELNKFYQNNLQNFYYSDSVSLCCYKSQIQIVMHHLEQYLQYEYDIDTEGEFNYEQLF